MPNAGVFWEKLLYGLAGASSGPPAQRRDRILAALREVGYDPGTGGVHDDAALAAQPPHQLIIVASDGTDDDVTLVAIPDAQLADADRAALDLLDGSAIDLGTEDDHPDLYRAWQQIALSTGARSTDWFEGAGQMVLDNASELDDRWSDYAFRPGRHGRIDGARLDRNFTRVTFVIERV